MKVITTAVVSAAAALILTPAANADPASDFLGCLNNHGVTVDNRNEVT
jgi:hypothetical protein